MGGLYPDWLGDGGIILVAGNRPPDAVNVAYAKWPAGVNEACYVTTKQPTIPASVFYVVANDVVAPDQAVYSGDRYPVGVVEATYFTSKHPAGVDSAYYA